MRIAVVFPAPYDPARISLDLGLLQDGFADLGHVGELIAVRREGADYSRPIELVESSDCLAKSAFWEKRRPDLAIVITWMGRAPILEAIKDSGSIVVSKTDTDGLLSARINPWPNLRRMVYSQRLPTAKVGAAWFWLKKLAWHHSIEDREHMASARAADFVWVESAAARRELGRFLDRFGGANLRSKVIAVSNPVGPQFTEPPLPPIKDLDVIAVGRWDDPQKNALLVRKSLRRLLQMRADCRVTVVGRGATEQFAALADANRPVRILDQVSRVQVAEMLLHSKVILFGSRWEGGRPNAANEALACGCTIVGPRIPAFLDFVDGEFGRLPDRPGSRGLAAAVNDELTAWESGIRNGPRIAEYWRTRLRPQAVCLELLAAIADRAAIARIEPAADQVQ